MSLFTSHRERRLWFWTVAAVVAIYSTLGLAGTLAGAMRDRHLVNNSMFVGFLVLVAAITGSALRRRPGWPEIWVTLGVIAVYGMAFLRMETSPVERTHLIEYGLVAILIHQALVERRRGGRRVPVPAVLTVLLGWVDESIQWILPNRVYDVVDVGFNALAGLMAIAATMALAWARSTGGRWWVNRCKR